MFEHPGEGLCTYVPECECKVNSGFMGSIVILGFLWWRRILVEDQRTRETKVIVHKFHNLAQIISFV